jgi:cytochrome c-type biogenesis protein CcmH
MKRLTYGVVFLFTLIYMANFAFAATALDELTGEQKELQADLEHSLVAPCCWNMTVDQHDSPKSREVRAKITELVKQGKTKNEILRYFAAQPQYGERILATPSQDTLLGKSAYWLIPVAILFGAVVVVGSLKRWSRPEEQNVKTVKSTEKPENSSYAEKVENELKALE